MKLEVIDRYARLKLKQARLAAGKHPDQLAQFTCNSSIAYYDVENCDEEISTVLNLQNIKGLCAELGISARHLFGSNSNEPVLVPETIIQKMREHLIRRQTSLEEFEEKIGYDLKTAINNPIAIWKDWNLDCLRSVCAELGLNWTDVFE